MLVNLVLLCVTMKLSKYTGDGNPCCSDDDDDDSNGNSTTQYTRLSTVKQSAQQEEKKQNQATKNVRHNRI